MMVFCAPRTVDDTLAELERGTGEIIAGGTDLIVGVRGRKRRIPAGLVAIHDVESLRHVTRVADGLSIGATTSHATLYESPEIRESWSALSDSSALVGSAATRNTGTIGGNLANASPAMDTGAPLVVLGGHAVLEQARGKRRVPIEGLCVGPGRSVIESNELLRSVELPAPQPHSGSAYVRLEYRKAMEIAVVGVAAWVQLAGGGDRIEKARVALSAVAPTIVRAGGAEELLAGAEPEPGILADAGHRASQVASPIDDARAPASYRKAIIPVIARRALDAAIRRAKGEPVATPATRAVGPLMED